MEAILLGRLETAYRKHHGDLSRFVRSKVSDNETAEDIVQEVFARASTSTTEPIENLAAWLFRAASNRIIDWYRRRYRTDVTLADESLSLEDMLDTSGLDLHDEMMRGAVIDELYEAIDELPYGQREVLLRQAIGG